MKLYDLTTLCEETEDKYQNPFTMPVAILLYKWVLEEVALFKILKRSATLARSKLLKYLLGFCSLRNKVCTYVYRLYQSQLGGESKYHILKYSIVS